MKRAACMILALAMVLGCCAAVYGAEIPSSSEQRLVPINGIVAPGDYVGWTSDRDGKFLELVNEKDVYFAELKEEPSGLSDKVKDLQTRLGDDTQLTVTKIFELELAESLYPCLEDGGSVTIRFLTELKDGETLHVLHSLPDGSWEEITGSRLHFNADGTVDITFYNLGYVIFAVSTPRAGAAQDGQDGSVPTSPKTGRPLLTALPAALAVAFAAGLAFAALRRKEG